MPTPNLQRNSSNTRVAHIFIAALWLTGCGGGGGTSEDGAVKISPPLPQPATLTFTQAGPVSLFVGDALTNVATGQGTGAIAYSSNNTAVATVTSAGIATVVGAGTAIITATKAGDSQYLSANASYTINAALVPQTIAFATTGSIPLVVGATLTNAATGGSGTGATTYESSNASVATVTNAGVVTALSAGSSTITATKATDGRNASATASYSVNVSLASQTLRFTRGGRVTVPLGDALTNVASAPGTGTVSYQSSDTSVATVDALGVASVVGIGSVTITADKAADSTYAAATATYRLTSSVSMTAWIGANDTLLNFPSSANGLELIRSRDENCNLANYLTCDRGQKSALSTTTIVDTAATLSTIGYYTLRNNTQTVARGISAAHFLPRTLHGLVSFKDKMWVIGGSRPSSDVWSSADGATWKLEIGVPAFSPRFYHQVVEFNNQLWLFGGFDGTQYFEEVWTSNDGIYWTQKPSDPAFANLNSHRVVVFDNKLWLVGIESGRPRDVWSTADGVTWELRSASSSLSAQKISSIVAFKSEMWSLGSNGEAWSSSDGISWIMRASTGNFPERRSEFIVHDGRIWIVGGYVLANNGYRNDVWSSSDGINWTLATSATAFTPRANHGTLSFGGQLWVVGGGDDVATSKDDVWSSGDGFEWRQRAGHQFNSLAFQQLTPFDNKLWLIGGMAGGQFANTVRSSSDGIVWDEVVHVAPFQQRYGHRVLNYAGQLWLIGGGSVSPGDVWSSSNGTVWTLKTSNAPFSARVHHGAAVFNGKMWIIGGLKNGLPSSGSSPELNDVWSSIDGMNWTQEVAQAPFAARHGHEVVVYNGKMWLIGGTDGSAFNDVWSTTDGVNWTLETNSAAFPARLFHQALVFNNALVVVGGRSNTSGLNDVWSSTDGVTWTRLIANAAFPITGGHSVVLFDNKLWLIGGFSGNSSNDDIWSSMDGATWRRAIRTTIEPIF